MVDIVIDTQIFVDVLAQYYHRKIFESGLFEKGGFLTSNVAGKLNKIIYRNKYEGDLSEGVVCTSILTFIEISRKFESISKEKFTFDQFRGFLSNRPDWLSIAPFTPDLYEKLYHVPKTVHVDGIMKNIESADAIHCATYLTRENAVLATTDSSIRGIKKFVFID